MTSTNVLITGANGFAGSHILEALMQREGINPIAACRDSKNLIPEFRGEVRQGDLLDSHYLDTLLDDIDVVCHAAAWTSVWGYKADSERLFYQPSIALIDRARKRRLSRFVFLSSTSVAAPYGSQDPMSEADERRLNLWPHMKNVARIERYLRKNANQGCTMINLRVGLFAGRRYSLGLLPLLAPRLKTHLVPWVKGGKTGMPIVGGEDIGRAFALAVAADGLSGYQAFNIVGTAVPSAREVITFIADEYNLPKPHFSVPFFVAYPFGRTMELMDPIVPWAPLVTRSIVHLLEETGADNKRAAAMLGYAPEVDWRDAIRIQMNEMALRQATPMKMQKPITS